jgi:hypothetical protein
MANTKDIFCTREQKLTAHAGSLAPNGEIVFKCQTESCGRFIKFPVGATNIEELLKKHQEVNTGEVSIEDQEKKLKDLIAQK